VDAAHHGHQEVHSSPVVYHLIHGLPLRQQVTQVAPPEIFHVAGTMNKRADVALILIWGVPQKYVDPPKRFSSPTLIILFLPLPQSLSWHKASSDSELSCSAILMLHG
jgi:hypothetical protein